MCTFLSMVDRVEINMHKIKKMLLIVYLNILDETKCLTTGRNELKTLLQMTTRQMYGGKLRKSRNILLNSINQIVEQKPKKGA